MLNWARSDPSGGRSAMGVPTGNLLDIRTATGTRRSRHAHCRMNIASQNFGHPLGDGLAQGPAPHADELKEQTAGDDPRCPACVFPRCAEAIIPVLAFFTGGRAGSGKSSRRLS